MRKQRVKTPPPETYLSSEYDLNQLQVRQLKKILSVHNIDFTGVTLKKDLIKLCKHKLPNESLFGNGEASQVEHSDAGVVHIRHSPVKKKGEHSNESTIRQSPVRNTQPASNLHISAFSSDQSQNIFKTPTKNEENIFQSPIRTVSKVIKKGDNDTKYKTRNILFDKKIAETEEKLKKKLPLSEMPDRIPNLFHKFDLPKDGRPKKVSAVGSNMSSREFAYETAKNRLKDHLQKEDISNTKKIENRQAGNVLDKKSRKYKIRQIFFIFLIVIVSYSTFKYLIPYRSEENQFLCFSPLKYSTIENNQIVPIKNYFLVKNSFRKNRIKKITENKKELIKLLRNYHWMYNYKLRKDKYLRIDLDEHIKNELLMYTDVHIDIDVDSNYFLMYSNKPEVSIQLVFYSLFEKYSPLIFFIGMSIIFIMLITEPEKKKKKTRVSNIKK